MHISSSSKLKILLERNDVRQFIYDTCFAKRSVEDVLTAWVLTSWIWELWPQVPYIFFYGPIASDACEGILRCRRWVPIMVKGEVMQGADRESVAATPYLKAP